MLVVLVYGRQPIATVWQVHERKNAAMYTHDHQLLSTRDKERDLHVPAGGHLQDDDTQRKNVRLGAVAHHAHFRRLIAVSAHGAGLDVRGQLVKLARYAEVHKKWLHGVVQKDVVGLQVPAQQCTGARLLYRDRVPYSVTSIE